VPDRIAAIAYQNKTVVYTILFRATAETLRTIANDPKHLGAEIGFFAVLHSWGSSLMHPHMAENPSRSGDAVVAEHDFVTAIFFIADVFAAFPVLRRNLFERDGLHLYVLL
jgi:hypothetical protein